MKLLIDIQDNNVAGFMELVGNYTSVAPTTVSKKDIEILEEIKEIRKAFKYADQIKSGKLKGRPIEELLKEL